MTTKLDNIIEGRLTDAAAVFQNIEQQFALGVPEIIADDLAAVVMDQAADQAEAFVAEAQARGIDLDAPA